MGKNCFGISSPSRRPNHTSPRQRRIETNGPDLYLISQLLKTSIFTQRAPMKGMAMSHPSLLVTSKPEFYSGARSRYREVSQLGRDSRLLSDVPWRTHCEDTFIAAGAKHPLQKPRALIVKEVFVPSVLHKLWYHHNNVPIGIFL